ncbi:unnamed protein product [Sphacelaria rigidula]
MSVETTAVVAVTSPRSTATDRHMFLLIGVPALLSLVVTGVTGFVANPPTSSAAAGSHGDNSSTRQWRQPLRTVINTPTHATGTSATSEAMPTATGTTTSEAYLPGDLGGTQQFQRFSEFLLETQREICLQAEMADRGPIGDDGEKAGGSTFCYDSWKRDAPTKGFGITRVLEGGELLEKAACSVSVIHGVLTAERAQAMSSRGRVNIDPRGGQAYSAAALSLVFHTASPLVPTFRADVRYLEVAGEGWFGGGADLTPYYLNDGDISEFHRFYKDICDRYDPQAYPRFKKWADDYFHIPMRKEHRGVGGIFFDDLDHVGNGEDGAKDVESFVRDVALGFMPSFLPIAERRGRSPFTEQQRSWQLMRRGRYLEFNLLYDRGEHFFQDETIPCVKFGLSGGRVESIMVSAPPLVKWAYNHVPEEGSEEERLIQVLQNPREWASS